MGCHLCLPHHPRGAYPFITSPSRSTPAIPAAAPPTFFLLLLPLLFPFSLCLLPPSSSPLSSLFSLLSRIPGCERAAPPPPGYSLQCDGGIDLKVHSCFHNAVSVPTLKRTRPPPPSSLLPPSTLSSFSFFLHSHAISGPRPSARPSASPESRSPLTSPPSCLASRSCHPLVDYRRPPPYAAPFFLLFSISRLPLAFPRLPPRATPAPHWPPSVRPSSFARPRKDDTSGAIKSALIAAPDNSIPRVKIIGQERGAVRRWAVPPRSIRAACVSRLPGGGWWDGG